MIGPFAGIIDPAGGGARAAPTAALESWPERVEAGPLLALGTSFVEVDGVLCALDGAIYNHPELAAELGLAPGASPEVVIAHGYRRWGAALAPRLRGEFGLLAWDRRAQRGLLLPDQLGVRRLVVRRDGRRLWFATEVRYLLELLSTRPGPNPAAVSRWLTGRPAPAGGATLYQGIDCLGPGRGVELDLAGCPVRRYWQPSYREPLQLPRAELVERIGASLETAVARRSTPGAPLGVLLSGGLDSTSVAALAKRTSADGVCGFSVTFPDHPQIDESAWIAAFETELELPGVHLAARPEGVLNSGLAYLHRWQLPSRAWNEPWTRPLLARAAELGVAAMLSGEGGDDLFGSRLMLTADLIRRGHPLAALRFARHLPEAGGRAPRPVLARLLWSYGAAAVPPARAEALWRRLPGLRGEAPRWATAEMSALLRSGGEPAWRAADGPRWWAYLTHALTEELHGFGLLDHVRRRTDQHGIEARHPLLDLDLFELMLRVPPALCSEGELTRPLLRDAMAGLSPDVVRLRPGKSVFNDLIVDALVGPEAAPLRSLLGGRAEIRAYARPEPLAEMLATLAPERRAQAGVWREDLLRLAAVELWLRFQEDRAAPADHLPEAAAPSFRIESHGAFPTPS